MDDYEKAVMALDIIYRAIEKIDLEVVKDFYNDQFYPNISDQDASDILNLIRQASAELI